MKIEQIYTGCLAQGAYYIECCGEAAIIDPLREVDTYIQRAENDGAKIKYIFETHFHADFVSGHVSLAEKTGATIVYGPNAQTKFKAHIAEDGEVFKIGKVSLHVLHTPGHTLESTTYLLKDKDGKDHAIFTGDTLFLGDVGRPDLAQKSGELTSEDLAGMLYDSLREKIMPLSDDVTVYPAHGAGSACGKNMMKETVDSLGNQKKMNYALREDMTREEFIQELTTGLATPPAYFPFNVKLNKEGYEPMDQVMERGMKTFSADEFEDAANATGALILDVRSQEDFAAGHIPRSIFIGLDGTFAPWVGELIRDPQHPILLVAPDGREEEALTRLGRVGYDSCLGYLDGGFASWVEAEKEIDQIESVTADVVHKQLNKHVSHIIDVRKPGEFDSEHVDGAVNIPLSELSMHLKEFPSNERFFLHCAGGYRSIIASSILKSHGIHNMIDVKGGYKAMQPLDFKKVSNSCSSKQ